MKALPFAAPAGTRLVRLLGRGASFAVAVVELDGARVIAKRELPGAQHAVGAVERERRVLARVSHPDLPELRGAGEDAHGPYVLESLFDGQPLPRAIEASGGRLLAKHMLALLDALHRAEGGEIVHGDPSRGNFIALANGRCALIDFGSSGVGARLPAVGQGTLPYAAPELVRAETTPSQMTDRYAISVLVAELCGVALSPPLDGPALLLEIGERGHDLAAIRASDLPAPLRAALRDQLAFDPRDRKATLDDLRAALDRVA